MIIYLLKKTMSSDKNFHGSTGIIGYIYVSIALIIIAGLIFFG